MQQTFKIFLIAYVAVQTGLSLICFQTLVMFIRDSPPQFENQIMPWEYIRSITQKSSILLAGTTVVKSICLKKSLISRINEVYVFFNKISL